MNNNELAVRISNYLSSQTDSIQKNELLKVIGKIYTDLEKGKSSKRTTNSDGEKKKREPTKYNLFMRSKMAELKEKIQSGELKLSNREMMTYISKLWKEENEDNTEKKEQLVEEKKEQLVEESKTTRKTTSTVKKSAKKIVNNESSNSEEE